MISLLVQYHLPSWKSAKNLKFYLYRLLVPPSPQVTEQGDQLDHSPHVQMPGDEPEIKNNLLKFGSNYVTTELIHIWLGIILGYLIIRLKAFNDFCLFFSFPYLFEESTYMLGSHPLNMSKIFKISFFFKST